MIRWHGYLGGKPGNDLSGAFAFRLEDGKQPNAFHRLMQWLILIRARPGRRRCHERNSLYDPLTYRP
jgi:hypothetical protein